MNALQTPLQSLEAGTWFKAICGASFQHLPAIRSLAIVYALAGADCLDVAADAAVITAAKDGLCVAEHLRHESIARGFPNTPPPLLMASFNDAEDPHFRKAQFDPLYCPRDCPRPCEKICPAEAINFELGVTGKPLGVIDARCYGCGRCVPICPIGAIETRAYVATPKSVAATIINGIDAIEIHTRPGCLPDFLRLWHSVQPWINRLRLISISCPDSRTFDAIAYLRTIAAEITPNLKPVLIWQADGRPMSGDVGKGATMAAIHFGRKVVAAKLPGFVQLAGGTNDRSVIKLKQARLKLGQGGIAGIAYGSFARRQLAEVLETLETFSVNDRLEQHPQLLWSAVRIARDVTTPLKPEHPARNRSRSETYSKLDRPRSLEFP